MKFDSKNIDKRFDRHKQTRATGIRSDIQVSRTVLPGCTPQSHQCGFIAQSVEHIDELKYAVVGGQVC
ncbi:MAG: hypothetical protein ACKPKO_40135, partial [Candidatus Fonsibacter sp.]